MSAPTPIAPHVPFSAHSANPTRFNLSRWFAVTALVSIAVLATGDRPAAELLRDRSACCAQEAALTQEFVQSLLLVETPLQALLRPTRRRAAKPTVESRSSTSPRMPDVLRANLYDREQTRDLVERPALIGRSFGPQRPSSTTRWPAVVAEHARPGAAPARARPNTRRCRSRDDLFVEIYVPVRDVATRRGARRDRVLQEPARR